MTEEHHWRNPKAWLIFRPWQRHSLVLMIGGMVYLAFGLALINAGDLTLRQELALAVALKMLSLPEWGAIFVLAGSAACISSRWPSFSNSWGYAVLCGLASAWSAIYILGYVFGYASFTNVTSSILWALVAFMWWAISGLVNPDRRLVVRDGDH